MTIYRLIESGQLRALRVGRAVRIPRKTMAKLRHPSRSQALRDYLD